MARQITRVRVETPEDTIARLDKIQNSIDVLRAEIDRLNWQIRLKDIQIEVLRKERLNKEEASDSERIPETI